MKLSFLSRFTKSRRGLALVIVVTSIALISVLVVAIFSVTRTEFKATQSYVAAKSAKQLGDIAVSVVQAQIQNGQATDTTGKFHATQPGMVRVYEADGSFSAAYKLYSSAQMAVSGGSEASLYSTAHMAPSNWSTLPARYVDLNEPVVRPAQVKSATGQSSGYAIYYPVIDPRAAYNSNGGAQTAGDLGVPGTSQVEGFSYSETTSLLGAGSESYGQQVVTVGAAAGNANSLRLPMPVEWLYILQDGTLGALNAGNRFVATGGASIPSASNPIVGRIAFWADDESCKININTASEPTFLSTPFFYHERDAKWAHFPATTGEFQRYPGHPATTALSAVLAPNYLLDPYYPSRDSGGLSKAEIVELKQKIYDLIPKIGRGGSEGGTRPFVEDYKNDGEAAISIDISASSGERLFASVDEMLFLQSGYTPTNGRAPARFAMPGVANQFLFNRDTLERSRFFLTAHSRSPEFTLHGLPRVCMWPVADESLGANRRTTFDNMIALCATIKANASTNVNAGGPSRTYYFRRAVSYTDPDVNSQGGSTYDLTANETLSRNTQLLEYLTAQMSEITWPATSATSQNAGAGFDDKYGMNNVYQLAIQFFDYIRCTNLYDGILARNNDAFGKSGYGDRDSLRDDNFTFTAQRTSRPPGTINNVDAERGASDARAKSEGVLPGHGQVSPAKWETNQTYKGFGRMITISEIGLHFICTADGLPDDRSLSTFPAPSDAGRGGGTALRYDPSYDATFGAQIYPNSEAYLGFRVDDGPARWYSNFPPITIGQEAAMMTFYGCEANESGSENHPSRHPGFDPKNWNFSLAFDKPLQADQKRIQVAILLEAFCPSVGWTSLYPEYTIVLDGTSMNQMKLNGEDLFPANDVPIKSDGNIYRPSGRNASPMGGHSGPSSIIGGRHTRLISGGDGIVRMSRDNNYDVNNTSGHKALDNFALVSDFVTVNRDGPMNFTFPNESMKILIYDTHDYERAQPIQEIQINFKDMNLPTQVPVPHLVGSTSKLADGRTGAQFYGGPRGEYYTRLDTNGRNEHFRSKQGPHYWGYSNGGVLHRAEGRANPDYTVSNGEGFWAEGGDPKQIGSADLDDADRQSKRGRLDNQSPMIVAGSPKVLIPGDYWGGVGLIPDSTSDVIRTIVPAIGDYRVLAARSVVPTEMWMPHPLWRSGMESVRQAHSFSGFGANAEPGASFSLEAGNPEEMETFVGNFSTIYKSEIQLVGGAGYQMNNDADFKINQNSMTSRHPDLPPYREWAKAANAFGDFDTGLSGAREGPYINKPDEGNFYAATETRNGTPNFERSAYFREQDESAEDWRSGIYMTPNRLISSAVMFGSLPTGVWQVPGGPTAQDVADIGSPAYAPWQTLLFRPHAHITNQEPNSHANHPGSQDPADHYLLDMFFMPVVEPYAISEPLSTAGRVNMNYQIMPFTHIRRATGLHAVMKGEFITAIPINEINRAKGYRPRAPGGTAWDDTFWNDEEDTKYWHRPIDVRATLKQFDNRFKHTAGNPQNAMGLFRSATQICEMHLIPADVAGAGTSDVGAETLRTAGSQSSFDAAMNNFWGDNRATGDNVRERVYSNIYARLTTRSNTFRVHVRTQAVKKARSSAPDTFDPAKDAVISEYRGSSLLERYVDPNDGSSIPDYAAGSPYAGNKVPLDAFYRYRVLETKRFAP